MELKTNSSKSMSILFVEDDEIILEIQSSMLAMKFSDVMLYTAINGRQGLDLFKTHTPDIVITDINMSEMCGVKMAENIRELKPDTKIIAISGKDSDEIRYAFDYVITKPVGLAQLFAAVELCIGDLRQHMS